LKVWNPHTFEIIYEAVESGQGIESRRSGQDKGDSLLSVESGQGIERINFDITRNVLFFKQWNPDKELKEYSENIPSSHHFLRWNPDKELKVFCLLDLLPRRRVMWNPDKELKD